MNKVILFILVVFMISSCSRNPKNRDLEITASDRVEVKSTMSLSEEKGAEFLKMYCFACHNPQSESHDNMLAPPLAGIKYKYKQLYHDRDEFVVKMSDFILQPTKKNAVMKGPVRRFGLMPVSTLTAKEDVYALVSFIHDNKLDYPDWFAEHFEEEHGKAWAD